MNLASFRATGQVALDAAAASAAAQAYLVKTGTGDTATVTVTGNTVTVAVSSVQPTVFLGLIGIRSLHVTGTATATAESGITGPGAAAPARQAIRAPPAAAAGTGAVTGVLRGVRRCAAAALMVAGAAAVLAVLAAGLPWLMWHVTGWPLPRHIQSLAALKVSLTTRESGRFILDVITCAGWACWAAFIAGVLLEAAWQIRHLPELARDRAGARRTGRLRERAAGLSPPRALAALLIGGVLLGLLAAVRGTGGALTGPAAPRMPATLTAAVHAAAPPAPPGQARPQQPRRPGGYGQRPLAPARRKPPARSRQAGGRPQPEPASPPVEAPAGASTRAPGPGAPDSVRPDPAGIAPPAVITLTAAQQHAPAEAASADGSYTVQGG